MLAASIFGMNIKEKQTNTSIKLNIVYDRIWPKNLIFVMTSLYRILNIDLDDQQTL